VLASVVALGLMTALRRAAPDPIALAVVGLAGLFHGMAHAADVGHAAPAFELGMLGATALLHAAGAAVGLRLAGLGRAELIRLVGAGVAALGFALAVAS
jgi:urease accessory protein